MTAMRPEAVNGALDGLALIEASAEGSRINREAILNHADLSELIVGLVYVGAMLRESLAVSYGCPADEVSEVLRSWLMVGERAS